MRFAIATLIFSAVFAFVSAALACDGGRMNADMDWCLKDGAKNMGGIINLNNFHGGACSNDASKLDSGFEGCQKDQQIQDNYHSCTPGQRIDHAKAALARHGRACG